MKKPSDKTCYLEFVEGYLTCTVNHRAGTPCLMTEMREREAEDSYSLNVGDSVRKVKGYSYPGVIVSVFSTLVGEMRYVVEATGEDYKGMLHIFNGDQLEKEKRP